MSTPVKKYPKEILKVIKKRAGLNYNEDKELMSQFIFNTQPEGFQYWYDILKKYDHDYLKREEEDFKMFIDEFIDCEMKDVKDRYNKYSEDLAWDIDVVEPEEVRDSIVESVIDKFKGRSKEGFKKYGTNLDRDDLSPLEWLQHLQEELQDGILYAEKLKGEIEDKKETSYPLLKVETVVIKSPLGTMKFGVNEVSLNYSLDGKTVTLDIV